MVATEELAILESAAHSISRRGCESSDRKSVGLRSTFLQTVHLVEPLALFDSLEALLAALVGRGPS